VRSRCLGVHRSDPVGSKAPNAYAGRALAYRSLGKEDSALADEQTVRDLGGIQPARCDFREPVLLVCDIPDAGLLREVGAFLNKRWPGGVMRLAAGVFVGELPPKQELDPLGQLEDELAGELSQPLPAGSTIYRLTAGLVSSGGLSGQAFCPACKEFFPWRKASAMLGWEIVLPTV
jgi:hypothetical protein